MKEIIGVAGAGTMGAGIAQVAASAGHEVFLFDSSADALKRGVSIIEKNIASLVSKSKISSDEGEIIKKRIHSSSSVTGFSTCALVIEAVVEDLAVKQNLFKEIENFVSRDCILATNTSSLSVTAVASSGKFPERIAGLHFFNPAPLMQLVEIVPGICTSEKAVAALKTLVQQWKKVPVVAKDTPGFIVNRIARPFYGEAIRMYEEGLADIATIDHAMKEIGEFKMGPFELMDLIGNDINYTVTKTVWEQMFYDPRYKPSLTQKRLCEAKFFGKKSGRGYYNYAEGAVQPKPNDDKILQRKIFQRILSMLINEAADALYYRIASRDDIDLAMTKGVNYPKGLLQWADETGIKNVYLSLEELYSLYREERYRPSVLLKKMGDGGKKFYE